MSSAKRASRKRKKSNLRSPVAQSKNKRPPPSSCSFIASHPGQSLLFIFEITNSSLVLNRIHINASYAINRSVVATSVSRTALIGISHSARRDRLTNAPIVSRRRDALCGFADEIRATN